MDRIDRLKKEIMERKGSFVKDTNPLALNVALYRAMQRRICRVQTRAAWLLEQVKAAQIEIGPEWRLAGEHLPRASQYSHDFPPLDDPKTIKYFADLGVPEEDIPKVVDEIDEWRARRWNCTNDDVDPSQDVGAIKRWDFNTVGVYASGGWTENHSIRDFAKAIRLGFSGIRKEIEQQIEDTPISDPEFSIKENFWKSALIVCEAGESIGMRYAEHARELAKKAAGEDKERLLKMAETCERVPAEGARTFFEATQALWFAHIMTCGEDGINANSIGRMDQFLWPYYKADIEAGRLTREEAVEIMAELACKLYLEYDVQAITLGGVDSQGNDAVNGLSFVILDATDRVDFIRDLSIRVTTTTPERFLLRAAELIKKGGGIPFIFNDESFIPALVDRGIALEDARDYSPIGCIELTIPGKAIPHAVSGWFNILKCLELTVFNGIDPTSGERLGPATGELADMKSFEEFYAAYSKQVRFFAERMVFLCNRGELSQQEFGPLPMWSTLTDDCIARGRDISDGGAVYNYHSICYMGSANTADSMMAIKKLVFEDKEVTPAELQAALKANFEGHDALRQKLLRRVPKYGNDLDEVDEIAVKLANDFIDLLDEMRSPLNGRYFAHLFTFKLNIEFGRMVGATPDGRKAREPLAYSLSAHQGRDEAGVTAMLRSLSKLPHNRAGGASAAIIDLDPSMLEGEDGAWRLATLIRSALDIGVGQLQWNVTTVERLRQAQEDPERYGNIAVRVAGYSQMFRLIEKDLQEHIIARTKHRV